MTQTHDVPADTIRLKILVPDDEDLGYVDITLPRGMLSRAAGRILTVANKLMHRVAVASGMADVTTVTFEIDEHGRSRRFGQDGRAGNSNANGGPAGMPATATVDDDGRAGT